MESKGHIRSEVKPSERGPEKRVYFITDSGISQLKSWLIRILFSSLISKDELTFCIQNKLKEYQKEYQMLQLVEPRIQEYAHMFGKEEEVFYWKLVLKRGFYDVEAKLRWAKEVLKDISGGENQ